MPSITVHRLYYGPVNKSGWLLKSSNAVSTGQVLSSDQILEIYTKESGCRHQVDDSELLYTPDGPVIRVTRMKPLQGHDNRTMESCNTTLLVKLSDLSELLLPLLDEEISFPIKAIKLTVTK